MSTVQQAWPHRVFVPDVRDDGFLRVTYHEPERIFVVSTWDGTVCTAAVRVPVEAAPELIRLLANGLGAAAAPVASRAVEPARSPLASALRRSFERVRAALRRSAPRTAPAEVIPLRRR